MAGSTGWIGYWFWPGLTPPALPATLVARADLPADAPTRIKTLHIHFDKDGDALRSVDGLNFTSPVTEYPLIGSTEKWQFVNLGGGTHMMHIHLLEFQVVQRQAIDTAKYLQQWHLMNGHLPVTRPIVVDPTPFLQGSPTPANAYESGWKDTVMVPPRSSVRIVFEEETFTGTYVFHCHNLEHEDMAMMSTMVVS